MIQSRSFLLFFAALAGILAALLSAWASQHVARYPMERDLVAYSGRVIGPVLEDKYGLTFQLAASGRDFYYPKTHGDFDAVGRWLLASHGEPITVLHAFGRPGATDARGDLFVYGIHSGGRVVRGYAEVRASVQSDAKLAIPLVIFMLINSIYLAYRAGKLPKG